MFRKHLRFRRRLFVGLAFAALAAPTAAQAQTGVFVDGGPPPVSKVGTVVAATSEHSSLQAQASELQRFLAFVQATQYQQPQPSYLRYHEVGVPVGTGPDIRSEQALNASRITPLQADGLRWTAMARFYEQNKPSQAISERSNGVKGPDASLVQPTIASTSSGFDWRDAGIGASSAFAVALILLVAVMLGRRRQDEAGLAA
jgi:hypothetical protein